MISSPLRAGLGSAISVLFVVAIAANLFLPQGWIGWYRLTQSGVTTQSQSATCYGSGRRTALRFTFTVANRQYTGHSRGCPPGAGVGTAVVYLPDDPSIVATQFDQEIMGFVVPMGLGFPAIVGVGSYLLTRRKLRLHADDDTYYRGPSSREKMDS
jgi:hypothetical protein